jgi:subtilisin family serine protease
MNDHSGYTHDEPSPGDGGSAERPQAQDHKEPRQYFLPGMITMHIDHPVDVDQCKLPDLINPHLKALGDQLRDKLGDKLVVKQDLFRRVQTQNILTFPGQDVQRSPFSLVRVELNSTNQRDLITILVGIYEELTTREGPFELGEPGQGVIWQTVSPNWLLGSAGHGKPHPPSPGSWPLAKSAPTEKWKFWLVENDPKNPRKLPFATKEGANVHVAILDTAPCATDLDEAYDSWHDGTDKIEQIALLLEPEPNRKLRLVTDFYAEIELLDCSLARHRYWMADHGLFIAGEIASIAPESKLHLYKVFTSYGSASTLTIAQGLLRILTDLTDKTIETPLIVNCSFGLAAPTSEQYAPDFPEELQDPDFPVELRHSDILGHMQTSLRTLFDELTNQPGVIVVAAAGDDTKEPPRSPARFPAAYKRVIGVGALPKGFLLENGKYKAASYSNLADNSDDPEDTGFMTLGGEPRQGRGILGIYASDIPDYHPKSGEIHQRGDLPKDPKEPTRDRLGYTPNQKGSAEWAGTSFAAPIITGLLANWCSEVGGPITLENARQALINMSQSPTTSTDDEHVILVKQG